IHKVTITLATLILLALTALSAFAQDAGDSRIKLYAGFINGSFDLGIANNQGVNAAAQLKLYGYEGVRLEAAGDFSGYLRGRDKVYIYLAGPQVSFDLFEGRLTPFVRI